MSMREGRGRPRRDYPPRSEGKSYGRANIPPSRHLWIGNLPHNLTESGLARYLLQFGDLESLAFQQGRSYAFVNFINEEDAFAAIRELQGFVIEGNPLKIEFAKAEKSLREARPKGRGSPYSPRESRARHSSPDRSHLSKSKMSDKNSEPSEVLWVGFPSQLRVDEFVLRKAFSPFGEIEKITAFPGRTYAFVRFRNVMSASRAKEALHGKLFGNPRVHICFAKNESGPSNKESNLTYAPHSPRVGSYGRSGSFDRFRSDGDYIDSISSPPYMPNDRMGLARNPNVWHVENDIHDRRWVPGRGSELGLPRNIYDHSSSPPRNLGPHRVREFSPKKFPRQGPIFDDPWDLPEDVSFLHGTKKLRTNSFPENELPEYPLEDLEKAKRIFPRETPQSGIHEKKYDPRNAGYRPVPERLMNTGKSFVERGGHWDAPDDDFLVGSMPLPPQDRRKLAPDLRESSSKEVWRWEGIIAKGGTSVCRARCFPVGKPPDMVLPEFLDCTARTSLEMLAKHYYQASSAWVVFFAPADDPDISYYNEFMKYLGDKQRAAVVKLDERSTLFLVAPSDFSEKVLKVPGKLSISGVVLRLDPPGSSYGSSLPQPETRETPFTSFQNDSVYQKPVSPSGTYLPGTPSNAPGPDYAQKPAPGQNWSSPNLRNPNPVIRNIPPQTSSTLTGHQYSGFSRPMQEASHSSYTPDNPSSGNGKWAVSENQPVPSTGPVSAEQLAHLASSLLGQQGQSGGISNTGEYQPSGNINHSGYSQTMSQNYGLPGEQVSPEFPPLQFGQAQQPQPAPNLAASQREVAQAVAQANQQFQSTEQGDEDPQKRLQATLQLAAALLQQIQQGKGP